MLLAFSHKPTLLPVQLAQYLILTTLTLVSFPVQVSYQVLSLISQACLDTLFKLFSFRFLAYQCHSS